MTKTTIQTKAKQAVSSLLKDARDAGWSRAKFEMKPDGSVTVDAGMGDPAFMRIAAICVSFVGHAGNR